MIFVRFCKGFIKFVSFLERFLTHMLAGFVNCGTIKSSLSFKAYYMATKVGEIIFISQIIIKIDEQKLPNLRYSSKIQSVRCS